MHIFGGTVEAVDGKEGLGEKALLIFSQVTISLSHDYTKAFVWITTNCGKFLERWEYQTTLSAS